MARIFFTTDTLNGLSAPKENKFYPDLEMRLELTNIAATAVVSNDGIITVFVRDDMETDSREVGKAVFVNDDISIEAQEGFETLAKAYLVGYLKVTEFLFQNNLLNRFRELDESDGIIIEGGEGEFSALFVSGKSRPSLECTSLFGENGLARPYLDEMSDDLMMDFMDKDELEELAQEGDSNAMLKLGEVYYNDDEPDYKKAMHWFKKAAEKNISSAMFNIGIMYIKGQGCTADLEEAKKWMKDAAKNGDSDAVGFIEVIEENLVLVKKADSGNAAAMAKLAEFYMKSGNYAGAFTYSQRAANLGDPDGMWILALAYSHGRGVDENEDKAVELYKKGAELGHAASQQSLGVCYAQGNGVDCDERLAFELFSKSAEQGNTLAARSLGHCYQFGIGIVEDMSKAIEWYEKYLEENDDEELAQKVQVFKMMGEGGMFDIDDDEDEEDVIDTDGLPEGYLEAMQAFSDAKEYERELYEQGYAPELPFDDDDDGIMDIESFPRVIRKADEGDARAISIVNALQDM